AEEGVTEDARRVERAAPGGVEDQEPDGDHRGADQARDDPLLPDAVGGQRAALLVGRAGDVGLADHRGAPFRAVALPSRSSKHKGPRWPFPWSARASEDCPTIRSRGMLPPRRPDSVAVEGTLCPPPNGCQCRYPKGDGTYPSSSAGAAE